MATLYYNAADDTDWSNLLNWWTDDTFDTQATALPTSSDDVVLSGMCDDNSGSEPTVVNMTMTGNDGFRITITVTGQAIFEGGTFTDGTITGDCTFNDSSASDAGTINGNCTFNEDSYNLGGTINGDCTFNGNSTNDSPGVINGNCTFNGSSHNDADVFGNAEFYDESYNNDMGYVFGDAAFADRSTSNDSYMQGMLTISGDPVVGFSGTAGYMISNAIINLTFSREAPWPPLRGINGSSILGVV